MMVDGFTAFLIGARCQAMAPLLPVMFGMPGCVEPAAPA